MPATIAAGAYRLRVCADDVKRIKETKERNNCRMAALSTQIASPGDLDPVADPDRVRHERADAGTVPVAGPDDRIVPVPARRRRRPRRRRRRARLPNPRRRPPTCPAATTPSRRHRPARRAARPRQRRRPAHGGQFAFLYTGPGRRADRRRRRRHRAGARRRHPRPRASTPPVTPCRASPSPSPTTPSSGRPVTRADGRYDLAVNAGGPLTLRYERPTYMPVDRDRGPGLLDYDGRRRRRPHAARRHEDGDRAATPATAGRPLEHRDRRRRQPRADLIFMPGTTRRDAHAGRQHAAAGTSMTCGSPSTRSATTGRRRCRASCRHPPPTPTRPTTRVDEAVEAGATGVEFDQPVSSTRRTSSASPIGTVVPIGSYDRAKQEWQAERNGRVLKITGEPGWRTPNSTATTVSPFTDGRMQMLADALRARRGAVARGTRPLLALGRQLALRAAGRREGAQAAQDAEEAQAARQAQARPRPQGSRTPARSSPVRPSTATSRAAARDAAGRRHPVHARTTPAPAPAGRPHRRERRRHPADRSRRPRLAGARRAGRRGRRAGAFEPSRPRRQPHPPFTWDGKDGYGRALGGGVHWATATIRYVYPGVYRTPAENAVAFGRYGNTISAIRAARAEVVLDSFFHLLGRHGRPATPGTSAAGRSTALHTSTRRRARSHSAPANSAASRPTPPRLRRPRSRTRMRTGTLMAVAGSSPGEQRTPTVRSREDRRPRSVDHPPGGTGAVLHRHRVRRPRRRLAADRRDGTSARGSATSSSTGRSSTSTGTGPSSGSRATRTNGTNRRPTRTGSRSTRSSSRTRSRSRSGPAATSMYATSPGGACSAPACRASTPTGASRRSSSRSTNPTTRTSTAARRATSTGSTSPTTARWSCGAASGNRTTSATRRSTDCGRTGNWSASPGRRSSPSASTADPWRWARTGRSSSARSSSSTPGRWTARRSRWPAGRRAARVSSAGARWPRTSASQIPSRCAATAAS